jgi:hypothetical protein
MPYYLEELFISNFLYIEGEPDGRLRLEGQVVDGAIILKLTFNK